MKQFAPAYYPAFRCIADRCRHNCCIGWEIDIDEDTAAYYKTVDGALRTRLDNGIRETDGVCSFVLTADERCPFLNERGLCDIIAQLGENALCQICTDHPRFRNHFSDRTEIGLGLCCEEAARILLTATSDELIEMDDDGFADELFDDERALLDARDALFAIARDQSKTILEREQALLDFAKRKALSGDELYAFFEPLERLEHDWSDRLASLPLIPDIEPPAALTTAFERLLVYFLYRHIPDALDDGRLSERVAFAAHSVKVLRLLCAANGNTLDALAELSRQYSSEIEYSDENIDALLESF